MARSINIRSETPVRRLVHGCATAPLRQRIYVTNLTHLFALASDRWNLRSALWKHQVIGCHRIR